MSKHTGTKKPRKPKTLSFVGKIKKDLREKVKRLRSDLKTAERDLRGLTKSKNASA